FGHGLEGAGFRADGEENAWQAHVRLFTGAAVAAITTETRGQNSWLNFGPYGERNRTASVEDTIFADQKTGLMPEWTWTEGRADDESYVASRGTRDLFPNEMASLDTLSSERRILSSKGDSEPRGNVDSSGGMISALRQGVDNFWRWFGDSTAVDDEGR